MNIDNKNVRYGHQGGQFSFHFWDVISKYCNCPDTILIPEMQPLFGLRSNSISVAFQLFFFRNK